MKHEIRKLLDVVKNQVVRVIPENYRDDSDAMRTLYKWITAKKHPILVFSLIFYLCLFIVNIAFSSNLNSNSIFTISYSITIISIILITSFYLIYKNYKLIHNYEILLSLILISGFLLRFINLTDGGLHMDELWRLDRGRSAILFNSWSYGPYQISSISDPITRILVGVTSLFGGTNPINIDFYTRFFLGTVISTFTILIVFFIGTRVYNQRVGLLSAYFLAFSFEHLRLSRTFMSEPYLIYFITLTLLSFYMSLEKQKYIYMTMVLLVITILIKPTGLSVVPFIVLLYISLMKKRIFSKKQTIGAFLVFAFLYIFLNPSTLISIGNLANLFLGPVSTVQHAYGNIPIPWAFHFKLLYEYEPLLFFSAFATPIIALYKKEAKPFFLFLAGISIMVFITIIAVKGNTMPFHRHLSMASPVLAVMAGYVTFQLYGLIRKHNNKLGLAVVVIIILLSPINLYGDDSWMHYNTNVKGTNVNQIGLDLQQISKTGNDTVLYFFSGYETSIYGSLINYYYGTVFRTLYDPKPKLTYLPEDMYETPSEFSMLNGINYLVYKTNPDTHFNTSGFIVYKKYSDNVSIMKYSGPHIYFGSQKMVPLDNPFEVINKNVYVNKTYVWIEAEDATYSYGEGGRPYGSERSTGLYGIASNGHISFVKNIGSYSTYPVNLEKFDRYNIWVRLGAYSPIWITINNNDTFKISPKTSQFQWYSIGPVYLEKTKNDIKIKSMDESYSIYDALLITNDLNYIPKGIYKPRDAWGKPSDVNDISGYIMWQDEFGWHLIWQGNRSKNFTGEIITFDKIEIINYSINSNDTIRFNDSGIYFKSYIQTDTSGRIDFDTKSDYLRFKVN